jgi:hypothetical protein
MADLRTARQAAYRAAEDVVGDGHPWGDMGAQCDAFLRALLEHDDTRAAITNIIWVRDSRMPIEVALSAADAIVRVLAAGTYQETENG